MTLQTATISGQILSPDLTAGLAVTAYIEAATQGTRLTYNGNVIAGAYRVDIAADGTATATIPINGQSGLTPSSFNWLLVWKLGADTDSKQFTISGDTTWGALVDVSNTPLTNSLLTQCQNYANQAQSSAASVNKGVAGGTAALDSAGDVVDSSNRKVVYPRQGQHPLTGMYHAEAYGDGTLKTSNVNLAIADAVSKGAAPIYLKAGQWTVDDPINGGQLPNSLRLVGAGRQLTRLLIGAASSYGAIEIVGCADAHIEGIGITMGSGTYTAQYGILGGRKTGDASVPRCSMRDVYVYGRYTLAGVFMLNAEQAYYEELICWSDQGRGAVFARDQVNYPTVTARWTAISTTAGYAGGNGVIKMTRCQFITQQNSTNGPNDNPLTIEYVQTFDADSLYLNSAGPHLLVLDKRVDEASIRGLHEEWSSGVTGATEPYGIYLKNTLTGSENRTVRLHIDGSSLYSIYGADNVKVTGFKIRSSGFRTTAKAYNVDVWSADVVELPVAGSTYTATSSNEQTTPTFNRRDGAPLVVATQAGILKSQQTFTFGSVAANGGVLTNTYTVTGARVGDAVFVTTNPSGTTAGFTYYGGVNATDTVAVRVTNHTTAAATPAAVTGYITVFKLS